MNQVLSLKGHFEHRKNRGRPGAPNLPKNATVTAVKLESLIRELTALKEYWKKQSELRQFTTKWLISAYYIKIAAKSNRIAGFLSTGKQPNQKIVGAKFDKRQDKNRHVITYLVDERDVDASIRHAQGAIEVLQKEFGGQVTTDVFNKGEQIKKINFKNYQLAKSMFQKVIVDAWYVEKFDVPVAKSTKTEQLVTLYDVGVNSEELLRGLGIAVTSTEFLNERTVKLTPAEYALLYQKAPYLIAMSVTDLSEFHPQDFGIGSNEQPTIPSPQNEPTIGVIDTLFKNDVYFKEWVTVENDPGLIQFASDDDFKHGTEVTSIIVDGPSLNPELDDGCGRFQVKHFGVAVNGKNSTFLLIQAIQRAVKTNPEIKVWNLSLGSDLEIDENFISPEAALLDQIQVENNVTFVISATNRRQGEDEEKRIGAPADSINALVVGSVNQKNQAASYARKGGVLSFFIKPDLSYYGGDKDQRIKAVNGKGIAEVEGTSFAAPWIARKLAYLIQVMGLSREVAKALLVDAAYGWQDKPTDPDRIGNGVVPRKISDILETSSDEIRFVLQGTSESWDTYNYGLPIPLTGNHYTFFARATLCYFPDCERNQGVDYTNTELDLYFGRVKDSGTIDSIDKNKQVDDHPDYINEEDARDHFRKWDTVKHIAQPLKKSARPKKVYGSKLWGISIKSKDRLGNGERKPLTFGLVVTLKEMNGENRIEDFIQQFSIRGWMVDRIDIQQRVEIYNQAEQEIEWE